MSDDTEKEVLAMLKDAPEDVQRDALTYLRVYLLARQDYVRKPSHPSPVKPGVRDE